jgi:hypothetical protein
MLPLSLSAQQNFFLSSAHHIGVVQLHVLLHPEGAILLVQGSAKNQSGDRQNIAVQHVEASRAASNSIQHQKMYPDSL